MIDVCDRRYEWSGEVPGGSLEIKCLVWIVGRSILPSPSDQQGALSVSIIGIFLLSKVAVWIIRGQGFEVSQEQTSIGQTCLKSYYVLGTMSWQVTALQPHSGRARGFIHTKGGDWGSPNPSGAS